MGKFFSLKYNPKRILKNMTFLKKNISLQVVQNDLQKDTKSTSYAIQVSDMSCVTVSNCYITNFPRTQQLKTITLFPQLHR